jgi:hypothetical protein
VYVLHTHWTIFDAAVIPWALYYLISPVAPGLRPVYLVGVGFTAFFTLIDILHGLPLKEMAVGQHVHVVCFSAAFVGLNLLLRYGGNRFMFFLFVLLASTSINAYFRAERAPDPDMASSSWEYAVKLRWGHVFLVLPFAFWHRSSQYALVAFPLIGVFMIIAGDSRMLGCIYFAASALYLLSRYITPKISLSVMLLWLVPALVGAGIVGNQFFLKSNLFAPERLNRFEKSNQERVDMGRSAFTRILASPLIGYGSGQDAAPVFRGVMGYVESQVHGWPLSLALQYGILGLLFSLLMFVVTLWGFAIFLRYGCLLDKQYLARGFPFYSVLLLALLIRCFTSVYKVESAGVYGLTIGFALFCILHRTHFRDCVSRSTSQVSGEPVAIGAVKPAGASMTIAWRFPKLRCRVMQPARSRLPVFGARASRVKTNRRPSYNQLSGTGHFRKGRQAGSPRL